MANDIEQVRDALSTHTKVEAIFHSTQAVAKLLETDVIPVIKGILRRNDFEDAIIGSYYRMYLWLNTLAQLPSPRHIQAACNAARTSFELLIDIRELCDNPSLAAKYHAFTFVERFRKAQTLVSLSDRVTSDTTRLPHERAFVNDPGNNARFASELATHWPTLRPGQVSHWSGLDLATRAAALGTDIELTYRDVYVRTSWYVHAGIVGIANLSNEGIEAGFGWAHALNQNFVCEATRLVGDKLHLFAADDQLHNKLRDARQVMSQSLLKAIGEALEKLNMEADAA